MSIRTKFLLTILCITTCLIVIFYTVISHVVHDNFDQLEKQMVIESLKRVQVTLASQAQALSALAHYWASNDATSAFVNNHDNTYIARNIIQDPLNNRANIDLLLILNTEETLLLGVVFDKRGHKAKNIEPQFLHTIISHDNFLKYMHDNTGKSGIIQFGERYLDIAISPILNSNGKGPVHGTLVMGRILDTERIAQLQKLTLTSVNLYPVDDINPEAVVPLSALLSSESPYHITAYSDQIVRGYTFLNDLSGNAVLMLSIAIERRGRQQGEKTIFFLLYAIIFISLVFGLVFFFFIDIIISRRLSVIITAINTIEKSSDHKLRIPPPLLEDDLGKLTISINRMLDANEALEEYKFKNEKLEALATFAAGATHELATPLATIAVASSEILHDLQENTIVEEDLHEDMLLIRKQVHRCKALLYQLAAGAGEHMGEELISFSIQDLIDETLSIFPSPTIQQIKVSIQIADVVLTMPFLSLRRVLRGILKNSLDASTAGTPIFLSCKENHTHIIFEVMDQGEGMDEHTLRHAVDPFFTTKTPGKGTGLGLYLAQSLTDRFNGKLQITSSPSTGTTVTLSFAKENIYVGLR